MPGDGGLPDALPGAHDRERRPGDLCQHRRLESEVGPFVRNAERDHLGREDEPLARAEHRFVREVEHDLGLEHVDRLGDRGDERHAVVLTAAELLGAADENSGDHPVVEKVERLRDDGRVVLAVDEGDRPASAHRDVTSRSILPVYFSYSNVSVENWMIRSEP